MESYDAHVPLASRWLGSFQADLWELLRRLPLHLLACVSGQLPTPELTGARRKKSSPLPTAAHLRVSRRECMRVIRRPSQSLAGVGSRPPSGWFAADRQLFWQPVSQSCRCSVNGL
jgi:hypothetical protein